MRGRLLCQAVSILRRILLLAVLAVWLPATLHCSLEAAGFEAVFACVDDTHEVASDACDLVENGVIKLAANTALLGPIVVTPELVSFVCPPLESQQSAIPDRLSLVSAAPQEIRRGWQFIARAAPAPRAPSLVV